MHGAPLMIVKDGMVCMYRLERNVQPWVAQLVKIPPAEAGGCLVIFSRCSSYCLGSCSYAKTLGTNHIQVVLWENIL